MKVILKCRLQRFNNKFYNVCEVINEETNEIVKVYKSVNTSRAGLNRMVKQVKNLGYQVYDIQADFLGL